MEYSSFKSFKSQYYNYFRFLFPYHEKKGMRCSLPQKIHEICAINSGELRLNSRIIENDVLLPKLESRNMFNTITKSLNLQACRKTFRNNLKKVSPTYYLKYCSCNT